MQNGFPRQEAPDNDRESLWDRFCGHFHMRPPEDDDPQSWWIASTAIPLVSATTGPLANVMSIVALVMPWRSKIIERKIGPGGNWIQEGYSDPEWAVPMNAVSVFCGIVGNIFLLLNFTQTVRYIVALPVTIILWFLATGILSGLTASLAIYSPPIGPDHVYSQAYWSAVIAAILYFILGFLLMINMLGYFLGKYPQHFALTDDQRTLILQMTAFVIWLLIGAAIFQRVLGISFADALYFADVTVLTLGFGDVVATTPVGRGLIWPYAVFGIVMLGLVVGSIHQFAREVHYDNVVRRHIEQKRQDTFERSLTFERAENNNAPSAEIKDISRPELARRPSRVSFHLRNTHKTIRSTISAALTPHRRSRTFVMREEKDRFDAMRAIQYETMRFRRWNDLFLSLLAFGIVWTCGAVVFWQLEDLTYFTSLYFCFCSLLTIGYGDITPQSNPGRPFFVLWSLIAIPTMTILISQMSDTVVAGFKRGTDRFADYFVMPTAERYKAAMSHVPIIKDILQRHDERQRVKRGFQVGAQTDDGVDAEEGQPSLQGSPKSTKPTSKTRPPQDRPQRTIEELARQPNPSLYELAEQLAFAIKRTATDLTEGKRKRYSYDEWVEFSRLIQFTNPRSGWNPSGEASSSGDTIVIDEDEYGVLNWDWIGENSPMIARQTEPEWVLDRLCESLIRYISTQEQKRTRERGEGDDQQEEATLKKEQDLGIEEG